MVTSSMLKNPRWAQGQDHVPPCSGQPPSPWDSPLPLQRLTGNTRTRGLKCFISARGKGAGKAQVQAHLPRNGDVLKEHIGSTYTREVGFRECSRVIIKRNPNLKSGKQQKTYFSFETENFKAWSLIISTSLLFARFHTPTTTSKETSPSHLESLHPASTSSSPPLASWEGRFRSP